jgi:hypothetical protein
MSGLLPMWPTERTEVCTILKQIYKEKLRLLHSEAFDIPNTHNDLCHTQLSLPVF